MLFETQAELMENRRRRRGQTPATVKQFESFGYQSDRIPASHSPALAALSRELVIKRAQTIVVVGHAFGSTMERKYHLGFRRALRVSAKLRQLIAPQAENLAQFPRFVVASVGDTAPRIGKTAAQDRRVAVIFRAGR